jgi:hypothetical protein
MFYSAADSSYTELKSREGARAKLHKFGISFLDDALIGIGPGDLVLVGAPSGIGKTQLCCNIAKANLKKNRRVHFIPLEADEFEIEQRLKYQMFAERFFNTVPRPSINGRLDFDRWRMGDYTQDLSALEIEVMGDFEREFKNLFLYRKADKFGINELIEAVVGNADKSDLFIIDHAHYFDFEDDNENRAMKSIAKTVRQLAIDEQKPIILVAHLRKRDRGNPELVAGLDEFHGSSDLAKIATRVVTIAQGGITESGNYETFFRVPKNRFNGGSKFFTARMLFNPQKGTYETEYRLGSASLTRESGFQDIPRANAPGWATHLAPTKMGGSDDFHPQRHWSDKD